MTRISAVIIACNEEKYIGRCIASLEGIADEIIVVDSFSTDSTEAECAKYNVKFFTHRFEGYVEQKSYAITLASGNYILSLDADEALSDDLRKSIMNLKNKVAAAGYSFNRLNNYCGKWIRHSRWYPDRQLRLFDRTKGKWTGPNPHDKFRLHSGFRQKKLRGDLLHWKAATFEEHLEKINRFSTIAASEYYKAGRKAYTHTGTLHMLWSFFRSYFLYLGFLDGFKGFMLCCITAWGSFLKYSKLRVLISDNKK
jgi:glycosyltransferase involved in cell wall biosynthesis